MTVLYNKSPYVTSKTTTAVAHYYRIGIRKLEAFITQLENVLTPILWMWKLAKSKFDDNCWKVGG